MRASPGIHSASPLVPAPRRADLGSDGFIAAAISPSAPAFPNSPNPLSRSVPGRRTEANCLLERAGSDARVTRCVFPLKQWGHLHARPRALFPLGTLGRRGALGDSPPRRGGGEGKTRCLGQPLRCGAVRPDPGSGLPTGPRGSTWRMRVRNPQGGFSVGSQIKVFLSR